MRTTSLSGPAHDTVRDLLIELGEVESGIADALSPDCDAAGPIERQARLVTTGAGQWLGASWQHVSATPRQLQDLYHEIQRLSETALPDRLTVSVPEGYAYYAVYPEAYFEAALAFSPECGGRGASVLGLRSIGTSLSAAFSAGLEAGGLARESWTVRPRAHPFQRRLAIAEPLAREWRGRHDTWWFVVDEGPGLSGSSLAAAVQFLESLGIPDDRIVIVAHWLPDIARLAPSAAPIWRRHRVITATLERLGSIGTLAAGGASASTIEDWSAGAWRAHLYDQPSRYPAVHPAHERLKWRVTTDAGSRIVKFAGLGRFGREVCHRYRSVADAGFGPPVLGLRDGMLTLGYVDGVPLTSADCSQGLVDRVADYLVWLSRSRPAGAAVELTSVVEMVTTNLTEALGEQTADRVASVVSSEASLLADRPAQVIDGHLRPHEWISDGGRLVKIDSGEHGDDHFFPGPIDLAWDLASVLIEFDWPHAARRRLLERYTEGTGDVTIDRRLPFYRLAYLAFRTGYTAMAAAALAATEEAPRLMTISEQYLHELLIGARQYTARRKTRRPA